MKEVYLKKIITLLYFVLGFICLLFMTGRWMSPIFLWLSIFFLLQYSKRVNSLICLITIVVATSVTNIVVWSDIIPLPFPIYYIVCTVIGIFFTIPFVLNKSLFPKIVSIKKILIFPSLLTIFSYLIVSISPSGSLISIGNTQTHFLINNIASWFGIYGIIFIVSLIINMVCEIIENKSHVLRIFIFIVSIILGLVLIYIPNFLKVKNTQTIRIAGIVNNSGDIDHYKLTKDAISNGADIILWQEALLDVTNEIEKSLIEQYQELSIEKNVVIGLSVYNYSKQNSFKKSENKIIFLQPNNNKPIEYLKAYPTPTEDIIPGDDIISFTFKNIIISCAICFDLDFPEYIRKISKTNCNLLLVPANDWYEIKAIHAMIPKFRAIENGINILRVTGKGISVGYNYRGKEIFQNDFFSNNINIFYADMTIQTSKTIYSIFGDILPFLCIGYICAFLIIYLLNKRKEN